MGEKEELPAGTADSMVVDGKQYHIGAGEGDLAEYILLCGDPGRAERASRFLDRVQVEVKNREYWTYTGEYGGVPVSIMSTGIGPDNVEIAVVEISRVVENPTLIRIGSSGGLQDRIKMGDLIISTGAVRLENTSLYYVHEGFPAIADYRVVMALSMAARDVGARFHVGLTATAPSFYAAQSRRMDDFPVRYPGLLDELARYGVLNYEMESSTLFTLATLRGIKAGTVCAAYSTRYDNRPITKEEKKVAEKNTILTGLKAVVHLEKIKNWPKMGVSGEVWVPE